MYKGICVYVESLPLSVSGRNYSCIKSSQEENMKDVLSKLNSDSDSYRFHRRFCTGEYRPSRSISCNLLQGVGARSQYAYPSQSA